MLRWSVAISKRMGTSQISSNARLFVSVATLATPGERVKDQPATFLVVCTDALDRQQGVIETPETVGHDEEHGKFKKRGDIGCRQLRCHRREPTANPLDEEGAPPASMMPKPIIQFTDVQLSIFEARSDQRRHGRRKPDRIRGVGREFIFRRIAESLDVISRTAADRFQRDRVQPSTSQSAREQSSNVSLAHRSVCPCDKVIHCDDMALSGTRGSG